ASLDDNNKVTLVSPTGDASVVAIPMKTLVGYHLSWAGKDQLIAVPTAERGVLLLDSNAPGGAPAPLNESAGEAWGVTSIPNASLLVVSYVGGAIKLWDMASRHLIGSMGKVGTAQGDKPDQGDRIGVGSLSVSPDGRLLAASSGDRFLTIYDI